MHIPTCYLSRRTAASIKFDIHCLVGAAEQSIKRMEKSSGAWVRPIIAQRRNSHLGFARAWKLHGYSQAVTGDGRSEFDPEAHFGGVVAKYSTQ